MLEGDDCEVKGGTSEQEASDLRSEWQKGAGYTWTWDGEDFRSRKGQSRGPGTEWKDGGGPCHCSLGRQRGVSPEQSGGLGAGMCALFPILSV